MWKYCLFILLSFNILLLSIVYMVNAKYKKESNLLTEKVNKLSFDNFSLQNNAIISKQGDCRLNPNILLYNKGGDSIKLSKLERNDYTLVFRYTTQNCSTCVQRILDKMLEFKKEHANVDILLLTNYRTQADKIFSKRIYKEFPAIYSAFTLGLPLEDDVVPYFFILDNDLRVIDTFIPEKELPELTQRYLEKIATTFRFKLKEKSHDKF